MQNLDRVDKILQHKLFLKHLEENNAAEADRRFCRHNMVHFLDVARIGMIINLEEDCGIPAEWIYAAALLHDLGRHEQYENGTPHEMASARIAPAILHDCGFDDEESQRIIDAISGHREKENAGLSDLKGVLFRADKASRACFACDAREECNWKDEKKNLGIKY